MGTPPRCAGWHRAGPYLVHQVGATGDTPPPATRPAPRTCDAPSKHPHDRAVHGSTPCAPVAVRAAPILQILDSFLKGRFPPPSGRACARAARSWLRRCTRARARQRPARHICGGRACVDLTQHGELELFVENPASACHGFSLSRENPA